MGDGRCDGWVGLHSQGSRHSLAALVQHGGAISLSGSEALYMRCCAQLGSLFASPLVILTASSSKNL